MPVPIYSHLKDNPQVRNEQDGHEFMLTSLHLLVPLAHSLSESSSESIGILSEDTSLILLTSV